MSKHITVDLEPASEYRRKSYGVLMQSVTEHDFSGPRIHNRHHGHRLDVWENRLEYRDGRERCFLDPNGHGTAERYSYLWSAQATVISARPLKRTPQGETLRVGDVVTLKIHGYVLGDFQVRALPLHDPHMVKVDTSSSASSQHYIETGEYLPAE